ncbi:hypothetical protein [Chryseobacterium sp. R2A-55]|uniref:hypothetical protein n=1 Tax=Chryseobacterium sp. R2A-55 TaxID=2744445 RepID=UPI001F21F2D8|nr:hypothetical protein [Chryseobacterium sp. R2A-55]
MESIGKKHSDDNLTPPIKSHIVELLCKANPEHPIAKRYQEQEKRYQENLAKYQKSIPQKEPVVLPELRPIDFESFYGRFLEAFNFFNGKDFDESANNSEGRMLARTIAAYLLKKKGFFKYPILNQKSKPNIDKGLMIIGDYGTGKTSIIKTFHQMIRLANSKPLGVYDVDVTNQFLKRYKLGFGYHTTNEVVKAFESISNPEEKEIFWKRMSTGMKYFDDVMTENTASNYGKIEVFKDIFEMRYVTGAKTIISMNYSGSSVDDTLDAIGTKYGQRVYDRMFEMFNIIELKGKSLRK